MFLSWTEEIMNKVRGFSIIDRFDTCQGFVLWKKSTSYKKIPLNYVQKHVKDFKIDW